MPTSRSDAGLHTAAAGALAAAPADRSSGAVSLWVTLRTVLSPGRPLWPFVALLLIVFLLLAMMYGALALNQGIRGFSAGESEWSKGRKEAVHQLERYLHTGDEQAWARFTDGLKVPLAYHRARLEMDEPDFRMPVAVSHIVAGGSHSEDAPLMVRLYRWFGWQSEFAHAIDAWREADTHIVALEALALQIRSARRNDAMTPAASERLLAQLDRIDLELLPLERAFSERLGEAARSMQAVLAVVLLSSAVLLLAMGACVVRKVTARIFIARTYEAEERFRKTFDVAPVGIAHIALDGRWTHVNDSLCRMLGYPRERLIGAREVDFLALDAGARAQRPATLPVPGLADTSLGERRYQRADGHAVVAQLNVTLVRDINGQPLNYVAIAHDVTESRRLAQELSFRAKHDLLTGLLNRYEFERRLKQAVDRAAPDGAPSILFYLDLDQFKVVNDTGGHMAGDAMLTELAALIRGCLRAGDTLARLGGDEFGILLQECPVGTAECIAEKIRSEIAAFRFSWGTRSFSLGVSIGIVPFSAGEYDVARLLSVADHACYAAKEAGRNQLYVSHPDDDSITRHHEEMDWLGRLQDAHDEDRFHLVWQPILPLDLARDSPPRRFEVLLRMRDPDGSVILPGSFLAAAERYGKIIELDSWVVTTVLDWLNDNVDCAERIDQINVNVSGAAMSDPRYIDLVTARIARSAFPADRLCFEVTETMAISNIDAAIAFMNRLSGYGCSFALDDFGIGSSSFAYLNALPVDHVKIDGAFVHDLDSDPVHEAITRCIIEVAHSMGKGTIAEFVETEGVRRRLKQLGCDQVQGFAIGAPTGLGDFTLRPARVGRPVLIDVTERMAV